MGKKSKIRKTEVNVNSNGPSQNSALNLIGLRQRLELEDDFITSLVNTFPPKVYFDKETQEKIMTLKHAAMDESAKQIKKQICGRQEMTFKDKHRRAKLDPRFHTTVTQIQEKFDSANKRKKTKGFKSVNVQRAEGMEQLHLKLEEKVSVLKSKRGGTYDPERKKKKRIISKAVQRKRKAKKLTLGNAPEKQEIEVMEAESQSAEKPSEREKPPKKRKLDEAKPVYNKDGKIIFSKFVFSEDGLEEKKKSKFSGKNYKKLLYDVSKEKEKINKLKEDDPSKADEFVKKKSWERAIEKAEGIKVKDDPSLLKKSLVKQRKKKLKNSKLWQERNEQTENKIKSKQEKRKKNIQRKKSEKLQSKIKRAKKKGRMIPGF